MQPTAEPLEAIQAEFARRKRRQSAVLIGMLAALLCAHAVDAPATVKLPVGAAVIAAVVLFSLHSLRCPACRGRLSWRVGLHDQKSCRHCGVALRAEVVRWEK